MTAPVTLALSGDQHDHLKSFLFPDDGKEAVVLLLCGRRAGERRYRLVVREIHGIPYDDCSERTSMRRDMATGLHRAHARPCNRGGLLGGQGAQPSERLRHFFGNRQCWRCPPATDDPGLGRSMDIPHGSAVMLPDGQMFGRVLCDLATLLNRLNVSASPAMTCISGMRTLRIRTCRVS